MSFAVGEPVMRRWPDGQASGRVTRNGACLNPACGDSFLSLSYRFDHLKTHVTVSLVASFRHDADDITCTRRRQSNNPVQSSGLDCNNLFSY